MKANRIHFDFAPSQVLFYNDGTKELRAQLKSLPREQRELLLLYFYFGKEPKELSLQYNIPANHVSHRLCYALKHWKKVVG